MTFTGDEKQDLGGHITKISNFLARQSYCSALNSWAAQQRRPIGDDNIILRPASESRDLQVVP